MKHVVIPILAGALLAVLSPSIPAAVPDHLPGLASDDLAVQNEARKAMFREAAHASRPGAENERIAYSESLCAALATSPPLITSLVLVRQLGQIGDAEAVPALDRLLAHDEARLREAARMALSANPSPPAGDVLMAALREATDARTIRGLIDALGVRRHPRAVPTLRDALEDPQFAEAAAAALAHIPEPGAARALLDARPPGDSSFLTRALLDLAATCRRADNEQIAARIYHLLMDDAETEPVRVAAVTGFLTLTESSSEVAMKYIRDPSETLQAAVVEAASQVELPRLQRQLARRIPEVSPELQLRILTMLARTGAPATEQWVAPLLGSEDFALSAAAAEALAVVGTQQSIPRLMAAGAIDAMSRISSPEADRLIARYVATGTESEQTLAIQVLANRRGADSAPTLLKAARGENDPVALAALRALSRVAPPAAMPDLVQLLLGAGSSARAGQTLETMVSVLRRSKNPEATVAVLISALSGADESTQSMIYKILVQAGSDAALAPVVEATRSAESGPRWQAIRALADWQEPNAITPLLSLVEDPDLQLKEHALAIRGLARLLGAGQASDLDACARGLAAARRPDETKRMLGAIGRADSRDALKLIEPYLENPDVGTEAATATRAIEERTQKK